MSEQRLIELEERLTFQEAAMQQLNDVVIEQGNAIDRLKVQLTALRAELENVKDTFGSKPGDERPPHY